MTDTDETTTSVMTHLLRLLVLVDAQKDYIDAIPVDMAAKFPSMPGFDRDWADFVTQEAKDHASEYFKTAKDHVW